jgi:sulfite reductase alpha subunit-like flavoprotein
MALMNGSVNEDDANDLLILYATEGGTAHESADRIARHVRRVNFKARIYSMDEYDTAELINESLVVFVVSTTGTGAQPRMMTPLWNMLLRADLPEDLFEDMLFGLFALGDTAYDRFCWPGKKLARRLQSLGAQEILPRGEGDEQHRVGIDGALDPWMNDLNAALEKLVPHPNGRASTSVHAVPPPRARVTPDPDASALREEWRWPLEDLPNYHRATVSSNERITATGWNQDVRHMEFDFEEDIS